MGVDGFCWVFLLDNVEYIVVKMFVEVLGVVEGWWVSGVFVSCIRGVVS